MLPIEKMWLNDLVKAYQDAKRKGKELSKLERKWFVQLLLQEREERIELDKDMQTEKHIKKKVD